MRMRASACAAVMDLPVDQCADRMAQVYDFAVAAATRWISSTRRVHHRDPPRIAAAYSVGAVRRTRQNRWHMATWERSTGDANDYITSFVAAYNAYRTTESLQQLANNRNSFGTTSCVDHPRAVSTIILRGGDPFTASFEIGGHQLIDIAAFGDDTFLARSRIDFFKSDGGPAGMFIGTLPVATNGTAARVLAANISGTPHSITVSVTPAPGSGGEAQLRVTCRPQYVEDHAQIVVF
jgi:hypothetical protein